MPVAVRMTPAKLVSYTPAERAILHFESLLKGYQHEARLSGESAAIAKTGDQIEREVQFREQAAYFNLLVLGAEAAIDILKEKPRPAGPAPRPAAGVPQRGA